MDSIERFRQSDFFERQARAASSPTVNVSERTLFDVDRTAPHVDQYPPGLLNKDQWDARSDVQYHSGDNPSWDSANTSDFAAHLGSKDAAEDRGGKYMHRLRVPREKVAPTLLTDAGANILHREENINRGLKVPQSVKESVPTGAEDVLYDEDYPSDSKYHKGLGMAVSPDYDDLLAFGEGTAYQYANTGEGEGASPSMVAPQQTIRTWGQDVRDQAQAADVARPGDPMAPRSPSAMTRSIAFAAGQQAGLNEAAIPADSSWHFTSPSLPTPDDASKSGQARDEYEASRLNSRWWDLAGQNMTDVLG